MRIGINIASYLPLAVWFPGMAVRAAKKAGYEFLQVLPLRGMTLCGRSRVTSIIGDMPVDYVEDTWNTAQSLMQVLIDKARQTANAPTLLDYAIFPTGKNADRVLGELLGLYGLPGEKPRFIDHSFGSGKTLARILDGLFNGELWKKVYIQSELVEVHPGLWLTLDEIFEKVRGGISDQPLVLDLWHLRHEATPGWLASRPAHITAGSLLGRWQDSLPRLLPYSRVIHVSPSRERPELEACLRGESTELGEMIDCIRQSGWDGDLIIEATLGLKGINFSQLSGVLEDFRGWLAGRVSR